MKNSFDPTLRARDSAEFLAIGKSTFWRWVQQGRIPPGIRLSARCTVWRKSVLEHFLMNASGEVNAQTLEAQNG